MNLLGHLFRKDFIFQRGWLIAFWATLPLQMCLSLWLPLHGELRLILQAILVVAQSVLALTILVRVTHADSFQGTTVFWKTRPIPANTLLLTKALFVIALLLVPFLIAEIAMWSLVGFSGSQISQALFGLLLVLLPAAVLAFGLAVSTRNPARFGVAIGAHAGVLLLVTLGFELLRYNGLLHRPGIESGGERIRSAFFIAGLLLGGCVFTGILTAALRRTGRWGLGFCVAGALVYLITLNLWPDSVFKAQAIPRSGVTIAPLSGDELLPEGERSQLLWSHFRVEGLETNSIVAVAGLDASFAPDEGQRLRFHYRLPTHLGADVSMLLNSPQESEYLAAIRRRFPSETVWFGNWSAHRPRQLPLETYGRTVSMRDKQTGSFSGSLTVHEFAVEEVGVLPLRRSRTRIEGGGQVAIREVALSPDRVTIELSESFPDIPFGLGNSSWPPGSRHQFAYVLHHPETGEAFVRDPDGSGFLTADVYAGRTSTRVILQFPFPEVRARLTGIRREDLVETARLHVFRARHMGIATEQFSRDGFMLRSVGSRREEALRLAGMDRVRAARLPSNPAEADYAAFVDEILDGAPETQDRDELDEIRERLALVGEAGLDAFIRRLPLDRSLGYRVARPLLRELVAPRHLPELRRALRRDPELVWLFIQKGWAKEASPVLRELLIGDGPPLGAEALKIAAQDAPPELYDQIRRHFVLLEYRHDWVYPVLRELPGFNTAGAVREAWRRARLGMANRTDVSVVAALVGLPEALDAAIEAVEQRQRSAEDGAWGRELRRLTGFSGRAEDFRDWLMANRGRFEFNPRNGTYAVATL